MVHTIQRLSYTRALTKMVHAKCQVKRAYARWFRGQLGTGVNYITIHVQDSAMLLPPACAPILRWPTGSCTRD